MHRPEADALQTKFQDIGWRCLALRMVATGALSIVEDVASGVIDNTVSQILKQPRRDDTLIQVVDEQGNVIAASPNVRGLRRIVQFEPAGRLSEARTFHNIPVEDGWAPYTAAGAAPGTSATRWDHRGARRLDTF